MSKNTFSPTGGGGGGGTDIQSYAPGTYTWTKPAGAKKVEIHCLGAGAGGASGRKGAAGSARGGGGGGGSGAYAWQVFHADDLPATLYVNVPAGGTGGPSITANDTNGAVGTQPLSNAYVSLTGPGYTDSLVIARSAFQGQAGNTSGGAGGGVTAAGGMFQGVAGGAGGAGTPNGGNAISNTVTGSGGGGGGISTANGVGIGGNGGISTAVNNLAFAPLGGQSSGAAGTDITLPSGIAKSLYFGHGGGGGAASITGDAGRGGNSVRGGGGGGGGAALNGVGNSGAGGNGGDGFVMIVTYS